MAWWLSLARAPVFIATPYIFSLTADAASRFFSLNNIHSLASLMLTNGMTVNAASPIHPHFPARWISLMSQMMKTRHRQRKMCALSLSPSVPARIQCHMCALTPLSSFFFLPSLSLSLSLQSSSGPECLVSLFFLFFASPYPHLCSSASNLSSPALTRFHCSNCRFQCTQDQECDNKHTLTHRARRKRNCLVICLTRVAYNRNKSKKQSECLVKWTMNGEADEHTTLGKWKGSEYKSNTSEVHCSSAYLKMHIC